MLSLAESSRQHEHAVGAQASKGIEPVDREAVATTEVQMLQLCQLPKRDQSAVGEVVASLSSRCASCAALPKFGSASSLMPSPLKLRFRCVRFGKRAMCLQALALRCWRLCCHHCRGRPVRQPTGGHPSSRIRAASEKCRYCQFSHSAYACARSALSRTSLACSFFILLALA